MDGIWDRVSKNWEEKGHKLQSNTILGGFSMHYVQAGLTWKHDGGLFTSIREIERNDRGYIGLGVEYGTRLARSARKRDPSYIQHYFERFSTN